MGAIGLNPIRLDRIGLDPIRINAIKLGVPGAASGTERPYIDPEVLASLKAVCICYGKSNDDPDRAVVKNLVDPDNPFVISNAAFKLNSGFGEYSADFESFDWAVNISQKQHNKATISLNGRLCNHTAIEVDEMKVNIIGNVTELIYWYIANPDDTTRSEIRLTSGINTLPKSYAKDDGQTYNIGFAYISGDSEITIEQIPSFQGAFVTDGIDDLITSTKTVQEMGVTDEVTVVSMIHQIALNPTYNVGTTNYLENLDNGKHIRSDVYYAGKTGIYGYTASLINNTASDIKNILGDKADYSTQKNEPSQTLHNSKFSVVGRARNLIETSSVAWRWTVIANKILTTDQINQVIAYFNLDRTLKPDILCNTIKQGITNENHAEFGDQLVDFVGGHNIQLNNVAWKGESGIGKYNVDFDSWIPQFNIADSVHTSNKLCVTRIKAPQAILYTRVKVNSMKVEVKGSQSLELFYQYVDKDDNMILLSLQGDGIYDLPASIASANNYYTGFRVSNYTGDCDITITQIPSHAGALCLDGVNDFGQFVGNLRLKDYTFIADKAYDRIALEQVPFIASKSTNSQAPFLMEYLNSDNYVYPHSFGTITKTTNLNTQRQISYQSTYVYNRNSISKGTSVDTGDGLTIGNSGSTGAQYSPLCLWSLMLFPYSMSEFLIERQLKKHKLGTLYPDMVEFRPIVKSNLPYSSISYSVNSGEYISVDSMVTITVTLPNTSDKLMGVSCNAISDISISGDNGVYEITGKVVKSPQKINLVISSYLTMLNNETLISNETLIKNE